MIYCILGMSGTGKTTIARRVAKECEELYEELI